MVLLNVTTPLCSFTVYCTNTSTVIEILNKCSILSQLIQLIQFAQKFTFDQSLPQHLNEMYQRIITNAGNTLTNEIKQEALELIIDDIERAYKIILNELPKEWTTMKNTPLSYQTLICCKKVLPQDKTIKELYGNNDKMSLKIFIE
ncbi:Uncharacterized protein QTN25_004942 [Entamoeba marina]